MRFDRFHRLARHFLHQNQLRTLTPLANKNSSVSSVIFDHFRWLSASTGASHASTVDEEEVERFSRLADNWWDESGEFGALHSMNDLRIPLIRDGLLTSSSSDRSTSLPLKGLKILDVGCGGGILCEPLARLGADVTGVDASEENIKAAKLHASYSPSLVERLRYECTTVEELSASEPEVYDGVVASEVIEHVANQTQFLKSCGDLVKPGGSIFLTTMNQTQLSYWLAIFAAERIFRIVPEGIHDWNKFISPDKIHHHLERENFKTVAVRGMTVNPLNFHWCWIENTSVNYAMHAVKAISERQ